MSEVSSPLSWAGPADVPAIAQLDGLVSHSPFGESHITRYCQPGPRGFGLVHREPDGLQGFVLCALVLDEGSIDNIAVLPAAQGQGVGSALLRAALAAMADRGARRCLLEVRESNTAALALYARHQFAEDGRRAGYYASAEGREDAILMSRTF